MAFTASVAEFLPRECKQNQWFVRAPAEAMPGDLMAPAFWKHVARKISACDEIRAVAYDGSWLAIYFVTYADGKEVRLALLDRYDIEENTLPVDTTADCEVAWGGPAAKFRVVRKEDKLVLQDGFANRKLATEWMINRPSH